MLTLQVNVKDIGASAGIAAILRTSQQRTQLHLEMAQGVEREASAHLLGINTRSPNTSFYGRAARSSETRADESGAVLSFTHRGIALRYYGGRVLPKNVKNLALPTKDVPLAGNEGRKGPREMGILAYLSARKGAAPGTTGYLVEGMEVTSKRTGKTRKVPLPGGKLLYVLRSWTDHNPDATVLPAMAALIQAATDAGEAYVSDVIANSSAASSFNSSAQ